MPSVAATEIINKLFSGNKDLGNEVNDAMMALSADKLDAEKKTIAKDWLKDPTQETPDETDNGAD
jgi:hypothetical protein|tara:strand:- start:2765 stop:2959 length:195 start_codon:yes stop_codon:yes gene_type:complete